MENHTAGIDQEIARLLLAKVQLQNSIDMLLDEQREVQRDLELLKEKQEELLDGAMGQGLFETNYG